MSFKRPRPSGPDDDTADNGTQRALAGASPAKRLRTFAAVDATTVRTETAPLFPTKLILDYLKTQGRVELPAAAIGELESTALDAWNHFSAGLANKLVPEYTRVFREYVKYRAFLTMLKARAMAPPASATAGTAAAADVAKEGDESDQ